eukprot:gb/GECG01003958.1/.p1 GENE.gb/GECG01003958.1/~~gb/GECG01003958.1/.p1  ORF type:complete len:1181 (+),score=156.83 gb/GECG01003958.1/:1-3543(+)
MVQSSDSSVMNGSVTESGGSSAQYQYHLPLHDGHNISNAGRGGTGQHVGPTAIGRSPNQQQQQRHVQFRSIDEMFEHLGVHQIREVLDQTQREAKTLQDRLQGVVEDRYDDIIRSAGETQQMSGTVDAFQGAIGSLCKEGLELSGHGEKREKEKESTREGKSKQVEDPVNFGAICRKAQNALRRQDLVTAARLMSIYNTEYGRLSERSEESGSDSVQLLRQFALRSGDAPIRDTRYRFERQCWRTLRHLDERETIRERIEQRISALLGLFECSTSTEAEVLKNYGDLIVEGIENRKNKEDEIATQVNDALRSLIESLGILYVICPLVSTSHRRSFLASLEAELPSLVKGSEPLISNNVCDGVSDKTQRGLISDFVRSFSGKMETLLSRELNHMEGHESVDSIFSMARHSEEFSKSKMLESTQLWGKATATTTHSALTQRVLRVLPEIADSREVQSILEVVTKRTSEHFARLLVKKVSTLVEPLYKQVDDLTSFFHSANRKSGEENHLSQRSEPFAGCIARVRRIQQARKEGRILQDIEIKNQILERQHAGNSGGGSVCSHLEDQPRLETIISRVLAEMCTIFRYADDLKGSSADMMRSSLENAIVESFRLTMEALSSRVEKLWETCSQHFQLGLNGLAVVCPQLYMLAAFMRYWLLLVDMLSLVTDGHVSESLDSMKTQFALCSSRLLVLGALLHAKLHCSQAKDGLSTYRDVSAVNFRELVWGWIGVRVGGESDDYASVADSNADGESSSVGGTDTGTEIGTTPAETDVAWTPSVVSPLVSSVLSSFREEVDAMERKYSFMEETIKAHMLPSDFRSSEYHHVSYKPAVKIPQHLSKLGHSLPHLVSEALSCPMATDESSEVIRVETDSYNRVTSVGLASRWEASVKPLIRDTAIAFNRAGTTTLANSIGICLMESLLQRLDGPESSNDSLLMQSLFDATVLFKLCHGERHVSRAQNDANNLFSTDVSRSLCSLKELLKEAKGDSSEGLLNRLKESVEEIVDPVDYSLTEPLIQQLVYAYLSKNRSMLKGTFAEELINTKQGRKQLQRAQKTLQRAAAIKDERNRPRTIFLCSFGGDSGSLPQSELAESSAILQNDYSSTSMRKRVHQGPLWKTMDLFSESQHGRSEHSEANGGQQHNTGERAASHLNTVTSHFRNRATMLMSHVGSYFKDDAPTDTLGS